jgi:hypothetical protein
VLQVRVLPPEPERAWWAAVAQGFANQTVRSARIPIDRFDRRSEVPDLATRLEAKVDRSGPHHLWLGARSASGSGQLRVNGKLTTARRVAWELVHGPLPEAARVVACVGASIVRPDRAPEQLRGRQRFEPVGDGRPIFVGLGELAAAGCLGGEGLHEVFSDVGVGEASRGGRHKRPEVTLLKVRLGRFRRRGHCLGYDILLATEAVIFSGLVRCWRDGVAGWEVLELDHDLV